MLIVMICLPMATLLICHDGWPDPSQARPVSGDCEEAR